MGSNALRTQARGRPAALLVLAAILACGITSPALAQSGVPDFEEDADLVAGTPGTDDGAASAMLNPAQWGLHPRSELALWWSDRQVSRGRRDDYGFATGRGLGFSFRHRIAPTADGPRSVSDYQIGLGWGPRAGGAGVAYGFSGPGRSAFGRKNFVALGSIMRPARWLSVASSGRLASDEAHGLVDLGVRPLSDPRLLLFGSYALRNGRLWDDGALSGGVAVRPVPGIELAGKWSERDRFQLTLGLTVFRAGFRTLSQYADSDRRATNYVVRLSPPVRGIDPAARFLKGRRFVSINLKGEAVYQPYRWFDRGSLPLRRITSDLEFAIDDPTVGGVALNLSGFDANIEMMWEVREKLLALRRAGKRSVVYCDRLTAGSYYLASAADQIVMDPMGSLLIPGVQLSRTYVKDALEKLKIGFEEWRYFQYKSALETFSRRDMSEADREQWREIVRGTYEELASGIAASARMTRAQFDSIVNQEPYLTARRLEELHWIDRIGGPDSLELAAQIAAGDEDREVVVSDLKTVRARRWQPDEDWGDRPTVALVYAIGDCAMDTGIRGRETSRILKRLRERKDVKAVVLRVDSPGGDPLASDLVAREIAEFRRAKKPLHVSQGRVAGSGGYWISMDGARIAASPFTLTGSIGVTGGWAWNKGFGEKLGLTSDRVQEGRSADLLGGLRFPLLGVTLPERNLDDREREVVKRGILELYDQFTARVADSRALPPERVRQIAEGRVYTGRAAMELKLVDRLASLDETIEDAKKAAGIPATRKIRVEEYPARKLLKLPDFLKRTAARLLGSAEADGELPAESSLTYEQRTLGFMLRHPGSPLLLTPASLLPDERAAR